MTLETCLPYLLGAGAMLLLGRLATLFPGLADLLGKLKTPASPAGPDGKPATPAGPNPAPSAHPILDRIRAVLPEVLQLLLTSAAAPHTLTEAELQVARLLYHASPDQDPGLPAAPAPAPPAVPPLPKF